MSLLLSPAQRQKIFSLYIFPLNHKEDEKVLYQDIVDYLTRPRPSKGDGMKEMPGSECVGVCIICASGEGIEQRNLLTLQGVESEKDIDDSVSICKTCLDKVQEQNICEYLIQDGKGDIVPEDLRKIIENYLHMIKIAKSELERLDHKNKSIIKGWLDNKRLSIHLKKRLLMYVEEEQSVCDECGCRVM